MKGTDINKPQMDAAEAFYRIAAKADPERDPVTVRRVQIIQLLAWYGAIRAEGARKGLAEDQGKIIAEKPNKGSAA